MTVGHAPADPDDPTALLDRCDAYLDAVPRTSADVVEVGPFTLFAARDSPWPYYARPSRSRSRITSVDDVAAVVAEQDARGLPHTLEWVHELEPTLAAAAVAAGLRVVLHPLMVLRGARVEAPAAPGLRTRVLAADDPAVPASAVVAALGFASAGTGMGTAGPGERDVQLAERPADADDHVRDRIARGLTVVVVAEDEQGVVGVGSHQPSGGATEVVGVATLPSRRRRGVAAAVTSALVADARVRGIDLVLLSASDDDVARGYERAGFTRIGHAGAAE